MIIQALHSRGIIDLGSGPDENIYFSLSLRPGQIVTIDDKYRILRNINSASNNGYIRIISMDSAPTSSITQVEVNEKANSDDLSDVATSGEYDDLENIPDPGIHIVTNISSDTTLTSNHHHILVDTTLNNITITLPNVSIEIGRTYSIKKIDSSVNKVIIEGYESDTIDGGETAELTNQYESITLVSDGAEWWIV